MRLRWCSLTARSDGGVAMSSTLDASQGNSASHGGAPPARIAYGPKTDTANAIDTKAVVSLPRRYTPDDYAMHARDDDGLRRVPWLAVILVALALDAAVAFAIYVLLSWLWP